MFGHFICALYTQSVVVMYIKAYYFRQRRILFMIKLTRSVMICK